MDKYEFPILKFYILLIVLLIYSNQCSSAWLSSGNNNNQRCPNRKIPWLGWIRGRIKSGDTFCDKFVETDKTTCVQKMTSYLADVYETEPNINQFTGLCKEITTENPMNTCVEIITELEKFCYDMTSAYDLIKNRIKPKTFERIGGLEILKFLLKVTKSNTPEKFIIGTDCTTYLRGADTSTPETVRLDQAKGTNLNIFKTWWENASATYSYSDQYCFCADMLYIPLVFNAKTSKPTSSSASYGSLNDYYSNVCLENHHYKNFWRGRHYKEISESSVAVDQMSLGLFLRKGLPFIDIAHWLHDEYSHHWSFDEIKSAIHLTPNDVDETFIALASTAIKDGLTYNNYKVFIENTEIFPDFSQTNCRVQILNKVFDVGVLDIIKDKQKPKNVQEYTRNDKFYVKNQSDFFSLHFMYLSAIAYRNDKETCNEFLKTLQKWLDIIYQTTWSGESLSKILELGQENRINMENMFKCLELAYEFEGAISEFKMLTPINEPQDKTLKTIWQEADDYPLEFAIFRYYLLAKDDETLKEICVDNSQVLVLRNKDKILEFIQDNIFASSSANNLQVLFSQMVDDYKTKLANKTIKPVQ